MEPVMNKGLAGIRFALGDFILMMGEDQILAAAMNVERLTQMLEPHGGALDMPARPTRSPRAFPSRLSRFGSFPQCKVKRVVLALIDIHARACFHVIESPL